MKGEAKALAMVWGCWLLFGFKTAPHRYNTDAVDTIFLVAFGLFTVFALGMTARFLYRLVTLRGRTPERLAPTSDHEESAVE
ncbi:hypothetical protein ACWEPZ_33985 [Streptomyces sp. NPDC004288]